MSVKLLEQKLTDLVFTWVEIYFVNTFKAPGGLIEVMGSKPKLN